MAKAVLVEGDAAALLERAEPLDRAVQVAGGCLDLHPLRPRLRRGKPGEDDLRCAFGDLVEPSDGRSSWTKVTFALFPFAAPRRMIASDRGHHIGGGRSSVPIGVP